MTTVDLDKEMVRAISALEDRHVDELIAAGIDRLDIDLGLVGLARGRVEGQLFAPDDHGGVAFVSPVRTHYPLCFETPIPASALRVGDIVDLVYFHPQYPRTWAVRTGAAEVLGLILPQYCAPEPIEIHRAPLGWLQSGCRGLVLLSRNLADAYRVLSACTGGIVAEDEAHADELRNALERPWPHPPITVRKRVKARHVL